MKDLVEYIIKAVVDAPEAVEVTETRTEETVRVNVRVAQPDMGRVIGRSGRVINAIRAVTQMAAARNDLRAEVELLED
jgi:hypothetical protein